MTDLLFEGKPVALSAELIKDLEENDSCVFEQTTEPSAYVPSEETADEATSI